MTEKQSRFVAEYLKTGNASEAYRLAYDAGGMKPETVHKRASELLANGEVAGRVAAHRQASQERFQITLDSLTADLIEDRAAARAKDDRGTAITATRALMELHGFKTGERKNERPPFEGMTDAELVEKMNGALGEAGYTIQ